MHRLFLYSYSFENENSIKLLRLKTDHLSIVLEIRRINSRWNVYDTGNTRICATSTRSLVTLIQITRLLSRYRKTCAIVDGAYIFPA